MISLTRFRLSLLSILVSLLLFSGGCAEIHEETNAPTKEDRIDLAIAMEIEITKDLELGYVPKNRLLEANETTRKLKKSASRSSMTDVNWIERGPRNVGGRTRGMIFDMADTTRNTILAGSVAGGIWRGSNIFGISETWTNLTPDLSNLAISTLAQDPSNPQIIYAGTGEGWFNGDAVRGVGIFKSEDGGQSWFRLSSTGGSAFRYVQKLLIDDNGNIYACTRGNGLMRSNDEGKSWEKVLGSNVGGFSDRAADIEIASDGTIYASLGVYSIDGLYRSTDNADSWEYIHGNGMPDQGYRRIEIAVSEIDTNRVYAILEASDGSCLGIYRSENKGDAWTSLPIPESSNGLVFGRSQLWYDLTAEVSPDDPDHIVIGAVNLFRSANGGDSWTQLSNWFQTSDVPYVHADQHNVLFDSNNPGRVLFANDGGIFTSVNFQIGNPQFNHSVNEYNVTQYYSCAVHPLDNQIISGGTQDNGTQLLFTDESTEAVKISGGDGGYTHFAGEDGEYLISSFTNNNYNVYLDFDFYRNIDFAGGSFINPTLVIGNNLYGNADAGEYFRVDVTDLSSEVEYVFVESIGNDQIRHLSISPNIPNRIYFGLGDGRVVYVDSVGQDIEKQGVEIFNRSGSISCVAVEPGDEDHILVTISNYGEISVYESWNGGQNWQFAENNLPDMPIRWAAFAPGRHQEVLLATEAGVWRTDSIQGVWTEWYPDPDFPAVRTDMIKIHELTGRVVVGTHGRGIFITDSYRKYVNTKSVNPDRPTPITVYPNPADDRINISFNTNLKSEYVIYSMSGKQVQKGIINQNEISIYNLNSGVYILRVHSGGKNYSSQFIKL